MEIIHNSSAIQANFFNNSLSSKRGIFYELNSGNTKAAIIGLGKEGIIEVAKFSEHFQTIGFDTNSDRVNLLNSQIDPFSLHTEMAENQFTDKLDDIRSARLFIITAKPALNEYYKPNLRSLTNAVATVAKVLKKRDHVIFKFTSFPGCIEDICLPILQKQSKLRLNRDFTIGFAPEKFDYQGENPDLEASKRLVSSSNPGSMIDYVEILKKVEGDYIHPVQNIRLTEILNIISHRIPEKKLHQLKYA